MCTGSIAGDKETDDRAARLLRESFARCRRDVSSPVRDTEIRNLIKRVDQGRTTPCEHIVMLLHDAQRRGASQAAVEEFPRALLALVESWYDADVIDLPTLIRRETELEATGNVSQIDLAISPTPKTIADAADHLTAHLVALETLVNALHKKRFEQAA